MNDNSSHQGEPAAIVPTAPPESDGMPIPAWEQIEKGRYMPRRVRGSCLGRELG